MNVPAKADCLLELVEGGVSIELGRQVIRDGSHELPGFHVEQPELRGVEGDSVFLYNFDLRDSAVHYWIQKS